MPKPTPSNPRGAGRKPTHGEHKKPINLYLTPTALTWLDAHAEKHGSRSEVIEHLARVPIKKSCT